ncbi:twin-arginine translocation signal domain-containing protein [Halalkalicoccus sp. NIPERK01]|uniref:twin-arginine translocation signal domain-containing protein n=1 Tax=Halalkalicoccus sp. NIPERK01 TaxID=3053469 RepID=UPI00256F5540|nr:twin-arginine translocation signal domain-containing protein [Halalkalicoccus sp. NIPERK01]MDL5363410.1 twin-arginine translocation signal domain-containing protein [Halalkalicoccus sp. NIPERK01]
MSSTINRRTVLKNAGTGGLLATGGLGLILMTDRATASGEITADTAYGEAAASDDGTIERIYIDPTGELWWEDFDDPISQIGVSVESRLSEEAT